MALAALDKEETNNIPSIQSSSPPIADLQLLQETINVAQQGLFNAVPGAILVPNLAGLLTNHHIVAESCQQHLEMEERRRGRWFILVVICAMDRHVK